MCKRAGLKSSPLSSLASEWKLRRLNTVRTPYDLSSAIPLAFGCAPRYRLVVTMKKFERFVACSGAAQFAGRAELVAVPAKHISPPDKRATIQIVNRSK